MATLLRAPAKLTTSLRVVGVRADGLHLIDAEMVSISLYDDVWVEDGPMDVRYVDASGRPLDIGPDDLVTRALRLADREATVRVLKRIPAGAGLGGGSSDAGAVLRWAGFDDVEAAAAIGADVAFCLDGRPARVTGVGEQVEVHGRRELTMLTVVTPPVHCSTPVVYRTWDALGAPTGPGGNDLEPAALAAFPELARYRDEFGAATGQEPRLAGSGSSWFVEGRHSHAGTVVEVLSVPPPPQRADMPELPTGP